MPVKEKIILILLPAQKATLPWFQEAVGNGCTVRTEVEELVVFVQLLLSVTEVMKYEPAVLVLYRSGLVTFVSVTSPPGVVIV